jgi:hypothetical protein
MLLNLKNSIMTKNQIVDELELCIEALKSNEDTYTINKLKKVIEALRYEFTMSEMYYQEIMSSLAE